MVAVPRYYQNGAVLSRDQRVMIGPEFPKRLEGAVVMGPMTMGSNLPYRRLCTRFGAQVTMGEMALAWKLMKGSRSEFALVRRAEEELCFGVQLAGKTAEELSWAAALAEERGADFVDLNLGCPIREMNRRGLGAALLQKPARVTRLVAAMREAQRRIPVTVKIRLGFDEKHRNHVRIARAAAEGGADAIIVHGRTRTQRYRRAADWEAIGEVVEAVDIPVIGNGDILFPHEIEQFRHISACAGVMTARGCLIKPWLFLEVTQGYWDITAEERLDVYASYVQLARDHWGEDERGTRRVRQFTLWHFDFWHRYRPCRPDGSYPRLQERQGDFEHRSPLEELLARPDPEAHGYITDCLLDGREVNPEEAPAASAGRLGSGKEGSWEG